MNPEKKFPAEYIERIKTLLGNEADAFFSALSKPPYLSVRNNPFKPTSSFDSCESVPWCPEGKYLNSRPSFTFDPLFHAGTYYVQEPSSMFLSEVLKQLFPPANKASVKVLDLCAAPGGKSTLILSEIAPESLVVANETIHSRIAPLRENLIKWGTPNVLITENDPEKFSAVRNYFDVIAVDAPCSGEGLFRKDERAIMEWSENNVKLCAARQKRILSGVFDSLKENGFLIYSTCTFSAEENDENVNFIASHGNFETVKISLNEEWGIYESVISTVNGPFFSYRFYPHRVKGEGFFISIFKRNREQVMHQFSALQNQPKKNIPKISPDEIRIVSPWLNDPALFEFFHWRDQIFAIYKNHWSELIFLDRKINIRSAGICIGKIINGELIPAHELALSVIISENVQSVDLDETNAIRYLKREDIKLKNSEFKGWTLSKFEGKNLGWIKILPNRINNYFPKEYRILKT